MANEPYFPCKHKEPSIEPETCVVNKLSVLQASSNEFHIARVHYNADISISNLVNLVGWLVFPS